MNKYLKHTNFYPSDLIIKPGYCFIYTLKDPRTGEIRYVGKANNIKKRFIKHINLAKRRTTSHNSAWIKSLLNNNHQPVLEILDEVLLNDWKFWEKYWISQFKNWGFNLTNEMEGGDGVNAGSVPWNKGTKGIVKRNSGSFKKGHSYNIDTQFKKGNHGNVNTEFKKGSIPANRKSVSQLTSDGQIISTFISLKEAAKFIKVTDAAIRNSIKRNALCKNYLWKYNN